MENLINPETTKLQNGITLESGSVKIDIIRSMLDGKMAAILSEREEPIVKCALLLTMI